MHSKYTPNSIRSFSQQGAALIMSLVILMVLTILGIASMNTSNLQLLMTNNAQYQTVALSQAELTVRVAEILIDNIIAGTDTKPAAGYYNVSSEPGSVTPIDLSSFTWDDTTSVEVGDSNYIIEYTGSKPLPPESLAWRQLQGIAGDSVYVLRITARSPAGRGAMRYVQSIYVTNLSPN